MKSDVIEYNTGSIWTKSICPSTFLQKIKLGKDKMFISIKLKKYYCLPVRELSGRNYTVSQCD